MSAETIASLFENGRVADLLLLVMLVEAVALALIWRATGRGVAPRDLAPAVLAGALLVMALRFALTGGGWQPIAACLAGAGLAHGADMFRRWK